MLAKPLLTFLVLIVAGNYAGLLLGWYWSARWYDIPMHIAGGAWIALLFFYLLERKIGHPVEGNLLSLLLRALGFVALMGLFWEFYEYLGDTLILKKYAWGEALRGQAFDTLLDLFNDLVGGILTTTAYFFLRKPSSE